ncbi:hypothetical protein BJ875DRAFT_289686 [Amylocarpus encephaloides]|uniref:Uncharacterized protein n=1 Tax=Amylocarpus encephaloides TaxID=45428 RepID=A0A9P8C7B9_9HELO|nr:hypothetical protein BJ875DRAFT_289686 [Amylocarpus encephaloides]
MSTEIQETKDKNKRLEVEITNLKSALAVALNHQHDHHQYTSHAPSSSNKQPKITNGQPLKKNVLAQLHMRIHTNSPPCGSDSISKGASSSPNLDRFCLAYQFLIDAKPDVYRTPILGWRESSIDGRAITLPHFSIELKAVNAWASWTGNQGTCVGEVNAMLWPTLKLQGTRLDKLEVKVPPRCKFEPAIVWVEPYHAEDKDSEDVMKALEQVHRWLVDWSNQRMKDDSNDGSKANRGVAVSSHWKQWEDETKAIGAMRPSHAGDRRPDYPSRSATASESQRKQYMPPTSTSVRP